METDKYNDFERYLIGDMSTEERTTFEMKLNDDPELKKDFMIYRRIEAEMNASYRSSEKERGLKDSLNRLNEDFIISRRDKTSRHLFLSPVLKGVAAVFFVLTGVYLLYMTVSKDISQEVSTYYAENYVTLSQTMGLAEEGIQVGIAAYNQGDYREAVAIFTDVLDRDPENSEALKNLGLSYLAMKDYASALHAFDQYSRIPDLFVNDGLLLQAITLLLRNEPSDSEKAEGVLKEIVLGNQPGKVQAEAWLKKLK